MFVSKKLTLCLFMPFAPGTWPSWSFSFSLSAGRDVHSLARSRHWGWVAGFLSVCPDAGKPKGRGRGLGRRWYWCFQETLGMSLNFPVVAYTLYSRVVTTFLFAKVASAGMTAKHRYPIFPDSLWQPSHFSYKMGIPYTLPKNYLLFIPMALTTFLGKEKVYTRQDMGIKKSSHESSNRTKEKCLTTLRKSI